MIRFFLASLLIAQSTIVFTQAQLAEIKKVSYDPNPQDSQPAPASKARYDQILGQSGTLKSGASHFCKNIILWGDGGIGGWGDWGKRHR